MSNLISLSARYLATNPRITVEAMALLVFIAALLLGIQIGSSLIDSQDRRRRRERFEAYVRITGLDMLPRWSSIVPRGR